MADVKELNINNTTYDIKAKTVVNQNGGSIKYWTGTKAQYEAIVSKDSTTVYFLTDSGKIYFGDTLISNVGNNVLFDFKWSDHQLNNVSWLRADTFSWQSGDVYTSAYNHLVADLQGTTAETETIGSYTVTFYRATDGHKICLADQEQTVINIYNESGIAWYYIVDTTNTQFKLPRTKYGFEGLRTKVGNNINESLPNIKGGIASDQSNVAYNGDSGSGALATISGGAYVGTSNYATRNCGIYLDASWSSSTYQDNAPVQERATQMYLYFYVGDYSQTAIEQTAGINSELFNGKADVDLSNTNNQAKILMSGMGMPSDRYINFTFPVKGAVLTAPANGWYNLIRRVGSGSDTERYLIGKTSSGLRIIECGGASWHELCLLIPVKKGDTVTIEYNATGEVMRSRFIYAKGSESEAQ